jgi:hypothetical protein
LGFSLFGLGTFLRCLFIRVTFYLPALLQLPKLSHENEDEKLSFLSLHEDLAVGDRNLSQYMLSASRIPQ